MDNIFLSVPNYIIYFINEEKAPKISELLKDKKFSKKDCSINWKNNINLAEISICENSEIIEGSDSCLSRDFFQGICQLKNLDTEEKELIGQKIIDDIMDGFMNTLIRNILDNNISYTVKEENQIFQITTISKQSMADNNMTIIDLGECENILKRKMDSMKMKN